MIMKTHRDKSVSIRFTKTQFFEFMKHIEDFHFNLSRYIEREVEIK